MVWAFENVINQTYFDIRNNSVDAMLILHKADQSSTNRTSLEDPWGQSQEYDWAPLGVHPPKISSLSNKELTDFSS